MSKIENPGQDFFRYEVETIGLDPGQPSPSGQRRGGEDLKNV